MSGHTRARIGVVGTGWWATRAHLPALERDPDAVIAAIADPHDGNRATAARRFGVPPDRTYSDVSDMLAHAQLDGAIVAVPHVAHARVARVLLEAGLHVLLEKPMTIAPADARALEALARERGVELIIGYPWQYNAHVRALTASIADGGVGDVEVAAALQAAVARQIFRSSHIAAGPGEEPPLIAPQPSTYADATVSGGGQGRTLTTHIAALLISMLGQRAVEVTAVLDHRELDIDLVNAVIVRFEQGTLATIASTGTLIEGFPETVELRLYGTRGQAHLDLSGGEASMQVRGAAPTAFPMLAESERSPEGAPARNLVDVVLGRGTNGSPAWLGAAAVDLVDALYRSAALRRPVGIDQIA